VSCPFCEPASDQIIYRDANILCLWDGFPVSDGHALVVPIRHFASWFEATFDEQTSLVRGIEIARQAIESRYKPAGFNIGINVGEASGQTVPHLHVHVIPRFQGDVYDPRGGVRHVIPDKARYWLMDGPEHAGVADEDSFVPSHSVFGNEQFPLVDALANDMAQASHIDIAVAFVTESGLNTVESFFIDLLISKGSKRFLKGD
jgi:diadenosine tetraphosphate (Ap4A) HIT family hydrolase